MARKGTATILFLLISAILGIAILATDHNLWNDGTYHPYALGLFVVVDLALLAFVFMRHSKMAFRVVALWGILQAVIMVADIFNGPSTYGTPSQFATYLFGLGYYDNNHIAFLFPALFVVRLILAAVSFMDSRKA